MNKSTYHFGIFFLGLVTVFSLFAGILQLWLGPQLYAQPSFIAWFLAGHAIALTVTIFLLKYFYTRAYWAVFYTWIASTIASLCFAVVFFTILKTGALNSYYIPVFLIALGLGVISALTLLFSSTGKQFWLRIAGAYLSVAGLILLSLTAWALLANDVHLNSTLGKIYQWTSMAASLFSIPLIMHFLSEARLLNTEKTSPLSNV
jgi:hypothetical protein